MRKMIITLIAAIFFLSGSACYAANWQPLLKGTHSYSVNGKTEKSSWVMYVEQDLQRNIDNETIETWLKFEFSPPIMQGGFDITYNPVFRSEQTLLQLGKFKKNRQYCIISEEKTFLLTEYKTVAGKIVINNNTETTTTNFDCAFRLVSPESNMEYVSRLLFSPQSNPTNPENRMPETRSNASDESS